MIKKTILLCTTLTIALLVGAFESVNAQEIQISQHHNLVSPFPDSELINSENNPLVTYNIALGILQRISGLSMPEETLRVQGSLTKLLYEVSREFSGNDVLTFFEEQFSNKGYEPMFECKGRSCGSSNDWANDIFGNRVLYGPAQNQFYSVYSHTSDNISDYLSLYIITRGNRRTYAYLEIMESRRNSSRASNSEITKLIAQDYISIESLDFVSDTLSGDEERIDQLAALLAENPSIQLYVVGHLYASEPLEQTIARSLARAESVSQALISRGISASRLTAQGVGPLSPNCGARNCRNRIELLKR